MIFRKEWKNEDGLISPPLWIVVQAIIEARLTGFDWAAVAPMVVGHGVELPIVPVPMHEGIYDRIKNEVAAFWRLVDSGRQPDIDFGRDGELLAQVHVGDERVLDLTKDNELPELVDDRPRISADRKAVDERWENNKARLLAKLDGAGAATMADGRLLTAKRIKVAAHHARRLPARRHDQLEEAELTEGQGRALSAHRTSESYAGHAKRTLKRALGATRKRRAHALANAKGTPFQNEGRNRSQNEGPGTKAKTAAKAK
jgi:hypothetical protein